MSKGSSGCDVYACLLEAIEIKPGERASVPTGLIFEIPVGYEIQVRPRSGLAIKNGLTIINSPGTIDSDYRGEVRILLVNLGNETVQIVHGDRIAQLVLGQIEQIQWAESPELGVTARDTGGFGSTGLK